MKRINDVFVMYLFIIYYDRISKMRKCTILD